MPRTGHRLDRVAIELRPAHADEIGLLDELAFRSKAHWGYPAAQMEAWRADLALSPAWVSKQWVHVALLDSAVAGVFAVVDEAGEWKLEHLWVEPKAMGKGVGRALLVAACQFARSCGAKDLTINADPNAAGFYTACGGILVGETPAPTALEPSRVLPVFRLPTKYAK
jgi:GNAT superfamily N-acetyltransferase